MKFFLSILLSILVWTNALQVFAKERETFFLGSGYIQHFMFTSDNSSSGGDDANVNFGGGYGFYLTPTYQGKGRWGVQAPFTMSYHRLSRSRIVGDEHVFYFGGSVGPLVRFFREPQNRWDPYFSFGLGMDRLTEGGRNDRSAALGISFFMEVAVDYHIKELFALHFGIPLRGILFTGDNLSSDGTGVTSIPLSLGVTWKF